MLAIYGKPQSLFHKKWVLRMVAKVNNAVILAAATSVVILWPCLVNSSQDTWDPKCRDNHELIQ